MGVMRVFLFGRIRIAHDGLSSQVKLTHTLQALLAFLLLQRERSYTREVLADLFWSQHSLDRARSCLNTALWRLRSVLEPNGMLRGVYLVTNELGEVSFNWQSSYWLDVEVFERQAKRILAQPSHTLDEATVQEFRTTLQLYSDQFLEGIYYDWALREKERVRQLYLNSLAGLMHYYKHHHAYEESLSCAQQILGRDPLREEIHREMMRLYLEAGQRDLAVRQYETCRQILATELGLAPMEETRALFTETIMAGARETQSGAQLQDVVTYQQAVGRLLQAQQALEQARAQLHQAAQALEQLVDLTRLSSTNHQYSPASARERNP